jgi:hypothetical protein
VGKKSEARAARRAADQERFEATKLKLVAKVADLHEPKVLTEPTAESKPRIAPHLLREAEQAAKQPKFIVDGSRFTYHVTWCVTKADQDDAWSWGEPREWALDEWDNVIRPAFDEFARLTWREIDDHSSESGHKMHHEHEISDLIEEAQDRWRALDLEQFDTVFRFRLGGTRRAWGFIVQAHFHLIWWDRLHSLYPTGPR